MVRSDTRPVSAAWAIGFIGVLLLAACSSVTPPTAQNIAGLSPDARVTMDETFVLGFAKGSGTLDFQGQTHPFSVLGAIVGPGGGYSKIRAAGEVYKLTNLANFPGRYIQGTGPAGLTKAGTGDLWLQNSSGVIMHLRDTETGALLSLGRDAIYIRMASQ
jgi:hypothetical protein